MLHRIVITRNLELYEIKESLYSDTDFYLLFLDYHRPSVFEDFSYIPSFTEDDFCTSENYIKAVVLCKENISDEVKDELYEIASGFLEDKDSCAWSIIYKIVDFDKMANVIEGSNALIQILNPILDEIGYPYKIETLSESSFNNLIQY
jgi:hypothetical protein